MIRSLIFDLDGTLVNTLPICIGAFRGTVEPVLGKSLSLSEVYSCFGPTEEGIFARDFPTRQEEMLQTYLKLYREMHEDYPEPAPGVVELIRAVKSRGVATSLVTAKGPASCRITLDFYKMTDLFEQVEVGSPKGRAKADGINKVINDRQLDRESSVYIGDSPKDVVSARKSGVRIWSAAWYPSARIDEIREKAPDKILYSIDEFKSALEEELGPLE